MACGVSRTVMPCAPTTRPARKFGTAGGGELTEHIERDVGTETSVEVPGKRRRAPPESGERSGDESLNVLAQSGGEQRGAVGAAVLDP